MTAGEPTQGVAPPQGVDGATREARLRGESLHVVRGGKAVVRGVTIEARAG